MAALIVGIGGMDAVLTDTGKTISIELQPHDVLARFGDAGWDRPRFMEEIGKLLMVETDGILAGAGGIEEGLPEGLSGLTLPKFRPGGLLVVHAGGPAGLFSAIIGGWLNGPMGSEPTSREIIR
jgi:hypothetical protein